MLFYPKGEIHMGATSVTGVGFGSVEGLNAGRKEYTVAASRLIGPRVVACGTVTITANGLLTSAPGSAPDTFGAGATVMLPFLPTSPDEFLPTVPDASTYPAGSFNPATYAVIATDNTSAAAVGATLVSGTDSAGNNYSQLNITGTTGHTVTYVVIKQGLMP
jgi:hypothetical protein